MILRIDPLDTLFFRDGKPFSAGEGSWVQSLFPPLPSTVYGAMRTAYIAHKGNLQDFLSGNMADVIGSHNGKGNFRINALCLQRDNDFFFPIPGDLVSYPEENKILRKAPFLDKRDFCITNFKLKELVFPSGEYARKPEQAYIDNFSLRDYLNGSNGPFNFLSLNKLVHAEPKVGIMRDHRTLIAQEHYLYKTNMHRLGQINPDGTINKVFLAVEFTGINDYPDRGYIRLGGEGKTALFEIKKYNFILSQLSKDAILKIKEENRFKLYLLTPAIFDNGWLPSKMDSLMMWQDKDWKIQLVGAVIERPLYVGGWDIYNKSPKPMYRAVPAGSVYFFRVMAGNIDKVVNDLNGLNISDYLPEEGFGSVLIGTW